MKDYNVLNDLVPKTQELHRSIFDKGYEQGQKDILEQLSYDDCISRQAVLNTLDKMDKALDTDRTVESYKELLTECYKDLLTAIPKKKTGKWIDSKDWKEKHYDFINFRKHCSLCNSIGNVYDKFCHNCGAKMINL